MRHNNSEVKLENYSKAPSLTKLLVDGAVSVTQTAFPRCTAALIRCIKNENKRMDMGIVRFNVPLDITF